MALVVIRTGLEETLAKCSSTATLAVNPLGKSGLIIDGKSSVQGWI